MRDQLLFIESTKSRRTADCTIIPDKRCANRQNSGGRNTLGEESCYNRDTQKISDERNGVYGSQVDR
ncbi:hypothetical protein SAMN02910447_00471 [Ruminococcus sp. YE71]|nr:hypothetical protein SAMN02910446_00470 [Ruminococcus sp. YE78]SFW15710.1 hypothetical protein SAMN02910447_00471 [Ruminococcus sp. YE71]